mmetsp:Transcript_11841/g.25942  ORF Transcript_11841/g.25942 Transcript_11841/m.25942 type:complete len:300 (-) Transcript_11841:185-1084(-)|eukprot:CAMPEP_0113305624 /NCGR_PEP_ID=MMETSP0010_2-20120614/5183_1 /TAXON_ID=216773 ORGANISM="Corethron hystrix, Strain 308" /NCGR_SAMPLE_ID=MMETSP0010_2 /ASSEMBLY_ACC=CAM_ASM_000155 /LENGTH=299 /DNA_ID=CAMNT_0000160093 /DNA_START=116 /DNA_END=1015 /DNA_ORIENTATION=- /assembly_acc=CAM_ASM_000155
MKFASAIALTFTISNNNVVDAFTGVSRIGRRSSSFGMTDTFFADDIEKQTVGYQAGKADHPFAKRFGDLAGKKVKTVGESMEEFVGGLDCTINPLYRSMLTDLVGTTHLTTVDARFTYDKVWALGFITSMDVLLKNYPERDIAANIVDAFTKSMGFDEKTLRADADTVSSWAEGKNGEDVAAALRGEGDSDVAAIAKAAKEEEYWLYSRFFGVGLMKMMEVTGTEVSFDNMKKWVGTDLGKSSQKAESDLTLWGGVKSKLEMMETLMKEVEIREKKKQAARLEAKAEAAMKKAEEASKI